MARSVDYLEILNADRSGSEHAADTVIGAYAEPKGTSRVKKKIRRPKTAAARRKLAARKAAATRRSVRPLRGRGVASFVTHGGFTYRRDTVRGRHQYLIDDTKSGGWRIIRTASVPSAVRKQFEKDTIRRHAASESRGRRLSKRGPFPGPGVRVVNHGAAWDVGVRTARGTWRIYAFRTKAAADKFASSKRASQSRKTHGSRKTLTARRPARSTTASEAKSMKKGKHRRSKAQKEAALRNLKKARSAQKRKSGRGSHSRKIAKSGHLGKGAGLKTRKKARKAVAAPKMPRKPARRSSARKAAKKSPKRSTARKGRKRSKARRRVFTKKMRAAALRNLGKARIARRRKKGGRPRYLTAKGTRHKVKGYRYTRKAKSVRVPAHRSYETAGRKRRSKKQRAASLRNIRKAQAARRGRRHVTHRRGGRRGYKYAMENPLGGVEIFVGGVSAVVWFMATDLLDRVLATHALTDKNAKDASGHELYADSPPTTGSYAALFNPTAICAPMNLARWGAGFGMTVVPVVVAKWITNPLGRSVFQMAGFGAGIRIVGKALIDLTAKLAMWTQMGQRLYDGEMRAQVLASSDQNPLASLPSAGLGAAPGCGCAGCSTGVGACTGCAQKDAGTGAAPSKDAGTGWPSMPREVSRAGGYVPPPPAPPAASLPSPGPSAQGQLGPLQGLSGVNALVGVRGRSPYTWGSKDDAEAV